MNGANGSKRAISVGIVGAGFGGVGMGIRLRQEGIEDFTIFERGETVGGVWRANTYPGAACDVPSHLYSFSFAHGSNWSRRYAPQPEILDYMEEITDRFGIRPHIRFETEAIEARFDAGAGSWSVKTDNGETHQFDVLVTACGQLTRPATPHVEGLDDFAGKVFHSAEWDHGHDLTGERVAVFGTGASAIQFVPRVAELAGELTIYQRSAPWIVPKLDRTYPEWERRVFERFPARVAASRLGLFTFFEVGTYGFTGRHWVIRPLATLADAYRNRELPDPELRRLATPDYEIGCKRILFSNEWYSTLRRENVELLGGSAERVTESGVVGPDGVERPTDTIIWGTGFETTRFTSPLDVYGPEGREIGEVWGDRPEAFLGITVAGFPNLFILYGPNTNHGSGSGPYALECGFNYILDAIGRLRRDGLRWIDLKPETQARWREELERRNAKTIWVNGGCSSWYVHNGHNTNNWPGSWLELRRRTRRIDPADYRAAV
jgi:cation diffusion facilitator CzcD-associated flavoprotein CzcO